MRVFPTVTILVVTMLAGWGGWNGALADRDRRAVRLAVDAGEIVELDRVLEQARSRFPGRILKVELEGGDGVASGWIYEVKILQDDGTVIDVALDARTLEVLEVEGDGWRERHGSPVRTEK